MEPNHCKEWPLCLCLLANERDGFVHHDGCVIAPQGGILLPFLERDITTIVPIQALYAVLAYFSIGIVSNQHIEGGETFLESRFPRRHDMHWTLCHLLIEATEMPLAEVSGGVAFYLQGFGQGDFFLRQVLLVRPRGIVYTYPPIAASCHAGRPGRTANRSTRIEAIEAHAGLGHLVEVRGLDLGMSVVADIAPSLVIRHQEHHVWQSLTMSRPSRKADE